ncbi:hypothetical protein DFH07DRAFT_951580 [Mycena maculata]|uniref:Uncharacterized protein n=1 Tax=Mycena maculata TaxID=230809 RepID=A0AAD7NVK1_9AGAR|nr:hypothetical protein DFH07DRAFT_951580 [Mycena maculata]
MNLLCLLLVLTIVCGAPIQPDFETQWDSTHIQPARAVLSPAHDSIFANLGMSRPISPRDSTHMQGARAIPSPALDSIFANLSPMPRPITRVDVDGLANRAPLNLDIDLSARYG